VDRDAALLARLPPEQLFRVMLEREKRHEPPAVAIVVPLGAFVLALAIVSLVLFSGLRRDRHRLETLRLMIEKGAKPVAGR
jgi:hypothetical protein